MDLYLTGLIDFQLWDQANWKGVAFGYDPIGDGMPFLGLMFLNPESGAKIFEQWRKSLGERDEFEVIRVSIVEGELPGWEPGYTVHVGTNFDGATDFAKSRGTEIKQTKILMTSRFHRMNPASESQNLLTFKRLFAEHKKYLFVPAAYLHGQLSPGFGLGIEKHEILFRNAADIGEHDLDVVVLRPPGDCADEISAPHEPTNAAVMDPERITTNLAILETEVAAGTLRQSIDPMILDRLASVQRDSHGIVKIETVDPLLIAQAQLVVDDLLEREALSVPLRDIQIDFVELLSGFFSDPYTLMTQHDASPHEIAQSIADSPESVERLSKIAPTILEAIRDYWSNAGIVTSAHLRNMTTLKAVYGGNVFPHENSDLISNVGLYADTLVVPDPMLGALSMHSMLKPSRLAYQLVKNGLTAMKYRELAIADLDVPLVVFAPNYFFLSDELPRFSMRMSEDDVCKHMQMVFNYDFASIDDVHKFFANAPSENALAQSVVDHDRFTLDVDELPLPLDQIAASKEMLNKFKDGLFPSDARRSLPFEFLGRFMQVNAALAHCDLYRGIPLIDAPTPWQFLLWKHEYAGAVATNGAYSRDTIIQHALHTELRDVTIFKNITPEGVVKLRREGLLEDLREVIRLGISEIVDADEGAVLKVAKRVAANLRAELGRYESEVKALTRDVGLAAAGATLTLGTAGLSIAAAVTGNIPLVVAGTLAGTLGTPGIRELVTRGREFLKRHRTLRRSPVGLFWRAK